MAQVHIMGGYLNVEGMSGGLPDNELPGGGQIDNSLPPGVPPIGSTLPEPPAGIWPPPSFNHPWAPIPGVGGDRPGHDLPAVPGTIWPPVNQHPPRDGKFWVVAGIPGTGWRYILVDVTQIIGKPDGKPPETAQPKGRGVTQGARAAGVGADWGCRRRSRCLMRSTSCSWACSGGCSTTSAEIAQPDLESAAVRLQKADFGE